MNAEATVSRLWPVPYAICENVLSCAAVGSTPFRRRSNDAAFNASKGCIVSLAACCSISNCARASLMPPVLWINEATAFSVLMSSFAMAPDNAPAAIAATAAFHAPPNCLKLSPIPFVCLRVSRPIFRSFSLYLVVLRSTLFNIVLTMLITAPGT